MIFQEKNYLEHYGILRKSGRYPWGSSGNESGSGDPQTFLGAIRSLKREGVKEADIAKGLGITLRELRDYKTIASTQIKADTISQAQRMRDHGHSPSAIAQRMGYSSESSVRALLAPGANRKAEELEGISNMIRGKISSTSYPDIGGGIENYLNVSPERLRVAVTMLKSEGYEEHKVQVPNQFGTSNKTNLKVLTPPGTTYQEVKRNKDRIVHITDFSENMGMSFGQIQTPISVSSKRVGIVFKEDNGDRRDGVIYVRPGAPDLSMGGSKYMQVRIAVDDTHYIKGMAVQKDDLPDGVDLQFHTNKSGKVGKLGALKKFEDDPEQPFGSIVSQLHDENGKVNSAMNIVNDQGDWEKWSKTLSSQFLSKQSHLLAKRQLDDAYNQKKETLDEINALTNPVVKRKLLEEFADAADSSAVHLKAAHMPRQRTQVILPINSLKVTEVYAPNFNDGEKVVLVRFPHGGTFEIPQLTVNNRNREGKSLIGTALESDGIGINSKVAERLSGADFDGDTVLVIPNERGYIQASPALEALKNFNPQAAYPRYEGMPKMKTLQTEMGKISNLITDMNIRSASNDELARAVRHSMVVIDSEKHDLNYRLSAKDNGIKALAKKYQSPYNETGRPGASTLISRRKSEILVDRVKQRGIDPATGNKIFADRPDSYVTKDGVTVIKQDRVRKLSLTDDANALSSGTLVEKVYADHSNRMKALATSARKASVNTPPLIRNASATRTYAKEIERLNSALNIANKNRPLERQARLISDTQGNAKKAANPNMDRSQEKKMRYMELVKARDRVGAGKKRIVIEPREWEAIQAGAISGTKLRTILNNADMDEVRKLATPKTTLLMTSAKQQRAVSLLGSGLTQAEVASILGVSLTTLKRGITITS